MQVDLDKFWGGAMDGQCMNKARDVGTDMTPRKVAEDEKEEQAGAQNCAEDG